MKTIALIEPNQGGHHLTYLRLFSKTLLEQGCQVMTFSPDPNELSQWIAVNCPEGVGQFKAFKMKKTKPLKLPIVGRVRRLPLIGPLPQPFAILAKWQQVAELVQSASQEIGSSPDLVFFNWLDSYLSHYLTHHLIDPIFPYSWAGLYFRPGQLRFEQWSLFAHHAIARSPRCQAVGILDEGMVEELQKQIGNRVVPFPDFTDEAAPDPDFELVKQIREKAGQRKIIGLFGALSKRKGLLTLLEAAQRSVHEDWFFVFAGALSKSTFHQDYSQRLPEDYLKVQAIAESNPSNCFFHFEHIPDEPQFNALVNACDVLFAAYENFPYSSNSLAKAAVFQKPVIVSDGFCMGNRVKKFELGLTIAEGDVDQCIEALRCLCNSPNSNTHLRFDFKGYHSLHSTQRLAEAFEIILNPMKTESET